MLFRYRNWLPGKRTSFFFLSFNVSKRFLLLQMWRYVIYGNVFSYPVIWTPESTDDEYIILASHNKNLYCLEVPRKTIEKNKPKLRYTLQLQSPIFATSWCESEYMFTACTDGIFKVFDLLEGKLLATKQLPGETFSSPVVHNNLAVLGCRDNNLYVLKLSWMWYNIWKSALNVIIHIRFDF